MLDEQFCLVNPIYASFRVRDGIGGVDLRIVARGAFEALKDLMLATGNPPNQLKIPRVLRRDDLVACMLDRVVA